MNKNQFLHDKMDKVAQILGFSPNHLYTIYDQVEKNGFTAHEIRQLRFLGIPVDQVDSFESAIINASKLFSSLSNQRNSFSNPMTVEEEEIMNLLVKAHNKYSALVSTHSSDIQDWVNGLHVLQDILTRRILRRDYPDLFITTN